MFFVFGVTKNDIFGLTKKTTLVLKNDSIYKFRNQFPSFNFSFSNNHTTTKDFSNSLTVFLYHSFSVQAKAQNKWSIKLDLVSFFFLNK
jgi:hypothetical protein